MSVTSVRGSEPIVGYRVTERLGAGGYGEVWKVEAPGGLQKAIKFIYGYLNDDKASRELKALNRVKQIRHPFLLSLERIEVIDGQLLIVTELADSSLKDRFQACKEAGLPAIPRDELLGYMRDAADALDFLSENALQHLDVKPENLLLVGGRIKVADFGLVKEIQDRTCSLMGGMTPVYAPPEVFDGRPNSNSDQYSLAIVYQEMLTGTLPFPGSTTAQLAQQHLHSRPRLETLPASDRDVVAQALAKKPSERFPNSRAMVDALLAAGRRSNVVAAQADHALGARSGDTTSASGEDTAPPIWPKGRASDHFDRRTPSPRPFNEKRVATAAPQKSDSVARPVQPPPKAAVVDLPPMEVGAQDAGLRPTLFLGIGGTAGHVLRRLRQRLSKRFGDLAAVPCLQMLLCDTDCAALSRQSHTQEMGGLCPQDLVAMPLRKLQEYRSESGDILQWLSRRWLYNIPRSLQTEGLRPLGRLALVDHAGQFLDRLRDALLQVTSDAALATSQEATGLPLRERSPRVFVVASISGGTGSGMLLDVGYAVQMLLTEMEFSNDCLCGILTHSTNRLANNKDLAIASAYACLSELHHYSREPYPGEPTCGLPAFDFDQSPFPHTYFAHLGNQLNDGDFFHATDALAEYLYLNAATAGGSFFDRCRAAGREDGRRESVDLRSLGLCQVGPLTEPEVSQDSLNTLLERARPRALEWGGARRLLLNVPEGASAAWLPYLLELGRPGTPTVLHESGCGLVACYEAEQISLANVAGALVCDDPQYAGAAHRLHTRIDIDWSSL